jgi:TetR/AcrR family transcriptional repressor of nem operon
MVSSYAHPGEEVRVPYPPEHKQKTRARIVDAARAMFNRHGFEQVSIDEIMKHAGLTRGGFYHHFSSKEALYAEAVHSFTSCNPFSRKLAAHQGPMPNAEGLARMLIELYLSDEILADVDQHCPLVALPSDVARAGLKPRNAYTKVLQNMLRVFERALRGADAERKAQLIVNLCVGGMVIARTVTDPALRTQMRAVARAQALAMLEP